MRVFIDTDIGSEMTDATALVLAASSHEIYLIGVTTVTGDTRFRALVAKRFLSLLGCEKTEVGYGAGDLTSKHEWEKEVVFGSEIPCTNSLITAGEAFEAVHSEEVVLVGIGPLTNISTFLSAHSDSKEYIREIYLMGGVMQPPIVDNIEVPRGFEYNFCHDVEALKVVLSSGIPIALVPGDLTFSERSFWTEEELRTISSSDNPVVKLLYRLNERSLEERAKLFTEKGIPSSLNKSWINDEVLMTYLLIPELFETRSAQYTVSFPDKYPRFTEERGGSEVTVVVKADFDAVKGFIQQQLLNL